MTETQVKENELRQSSSMIPLAATAAYCLEEYDFSIKGILNNISKRASIDRERSLDGPEPLPEMLRQDPTRISFVDKLVAQQGAKWMEIKNIDGVPVRRLADVAYGDESPMQSLDIYFPQGGNNEDATKEEDCCPAATSAGSDGSLSVKASSFGSGIFCLDSIEATEEEDKDDAQNDTLAIHKSAQIITTTTNVDNNNANKKLPVYIHIHGGGWSRGCKDSPFYGGPAMCQNAAAAAGCIGVAIGYRLGRYPEFLYDAASAIRWVYDSIESLGGDIDNVFLSGHSAGGHISSLLILRHDAFLEPLGVPMSFFKGLILVSGVYDLFNPMKMNAVDAKNKWFALSYATPAFGTDTKLKREASPLLLLDPQCKDTSLMGTAMRKVTSGLPSLSVKKRFPRFFHRRLSSFEEGVRQEQPVEYGDLDRDHLPPPTLILNATYDMGLQENGQLMAEALSEYTPVRYQIIEGADHASICWDEQTSRAVADFVQTRLRVNQPKKRRGKRDKVAPKVDD